MTEPELPYRVQVAQLLSDRGRELKYYVQGISRDPAMADDIFQEVSLIALLAAPKHQSIRELMPWLKGVARRKALRFHSKQHKEVSNDEALAQAEDEAPDSERDTQTRQLLSYALIDLSESSSELLIRRHLLEENSSEIGDASGRSGASVRMKLKRALGVARQSVVSLSEAKVP